MYRASAGHVIGCNLTKEMRFQNPCDVVARTIRQSLAYGSTPLSTWLALIAGCPELGRAMAGQCKLKPVLIAPGFN
jgi:hypothetical protein